MPRRLHLTRNSEHEHAFFWPFHKDPDEDETEAERLASARTSTHYRMNHRRRGVAAIFNQERFLDSTVSERKGSKQDVCSLTCTFTRLGFEVETYLDLKMSEIKVALDELSQRDHADCDCFALIFMSHGLEGKLRARDAVFDINLLWELFTAEHCPSLADKPKLFFIQACQGHGRQKGFAVYEPKEQSEPEEQVKLLPSYILPDRADFLVGFSTIPGFVSWRSTEEGSWYIQTLCHHLNRWGFEQDLLTLLTHVSRAVALDYTYVNGEDEVGRKQLPSVFSLLIRILKFTRKKQQRKCGRGAAWDIDGDHDEKVDVEISITNGKRRVRSESRNARSSSNSSPRRKRQKRNL